MKDQIGAPSSPHRFGFRRRNDSRSLYGTDQDRGLSGRLDAVANALSKSCGCGFSGYGVGQSAEGNWLGQCLDARERDRLPRRKAALCDDVDLPLVRVAVVGGVGGQRMPGEEEQVGVPARLGHPPVPLVPAARLLRDRETRMGGRAWVLVPALPGRRLLT